MATCLTASNSKQVTKGGYGIFSKRAMMISPAWLRITTPIPASPLSVNMAPSKFVLKLLKSGGFHFVSVACDYFFGSLMAGC